MYGRVTKYLHHRGFGFIRGEDGNTYFIHHSKLNGERIDKGYYVFFKSFQNDRSDYNAKKYYGDRSTRKEKKEWQSM